MIDFIFGAIFIWFAYSQLRHYKEPARASRQNIKTMAVIIMAYAGIYGGYRIWLGFGGATFGGF